MNRQIIETGLFEHKAVWQNESASEQAAGMHQLAREANQYYRSRYITLLDPERAKVLSDEVHSSGILESFQVKGVDGLIIKPLRWIKVQHPEILSG